jgi:hypothetical protein
MESLSICSKKNIYFYNDKLTCNKFYKIIKSKVELEYKVKYHYNKFIILLIIISILFNLTGCNSGNPIIPEIDPNPSENPENNIISYIRISTSLSTIKINQTIQFVVKGYNSDDEWVILDKSKIKLWKWTVQGCYDCYKDHVYLSPKSGSLITDFSSDKAGIFFIAAYYQEKPGDKYITDYIQIKVVN